MGLFTFCTLKERLYLERFPVDFTVPAHYDTQGRNEKGARTYLPTYEYLRDLTGWDLDARVSYLLLLPSA